MEGIKQTSLEGFNLTPENLIQDFERKRIQASPNLFSDLYSAFEDDQGRANNLRDLYEQEGNNEVKKDGQLAEAIVLHCIEKGALGSNITTRGASLYDDYFHGADLVIESKGGQARDPIVSSVDVTISQENVANRNIGHTSPFVSFDKKIERVKRHIDILANLSSSDAINISAWVNSGGLSHPTTSENKNMFALAEKLMLLKYYTNQETGEDPNRPHAVMAGPQIVISVDRSFTNKVFGGNNQEKSLKDISTLLQLEVPFFVVMITQYMDSLQKKGKRNLFFDQNLAACKAWGHTFSTDVYEVRLKKALEECMKDSHLREQFSYYQRSVSNVLR
jgi:hypothetical protein